MESIKNIFRIGNGPSSSHTMGPAYATKYILEKYKDIKFLEVILYGSLAHTGKGHLTDYIIKLKLKDVPHKIIFDKTHKKSHPNTIEFNITLNNDEIINEEIYSIGGGSILVKGDLVKTIDVYAHKYLYEIISYCNENNLSLFHYVMSYEGEDILSYLKDVYVTMKDSIKRGIENEGYLPGTLKVKRKAKSMYQKLLLNYDLENKNLLSVSVASFAVSEENASGGIVVTAPTCGSCGVIPGVITYLEQKGIEEDIIIESLCVAGLIGTIVKTNASVSGAVCGCQAEIGVACSMGAAMIMNAFRFSNEKIAQAAEIALEHSLGLTCDPIKGYVQIPCIERNAIFALKAINASDIATIIEKTTSLISFDEIVKTMYETGIDLKSGYKETSKKGMSKLNK